MLSRSETYHVGDRIPNLTIHVKKRKGKEYEDLTNATDIKYYLRKKGATTNKVDGVAATASENKKIIVAWAADDLDTAGIFFCWGEYQINAKIKSTSAVEIIIKYPWEDLDS